MAKYGKTDPSVYQLRDMNRRITRIEKKLDNHILKQARLNAKLATKISDISVGSAADEVE